MKKKPSLNMKKKPSLSEMELDKVRLYILELLQKDNGLEDFEKNAVLEMIREIKDKPPQSVW